MNKQFLKVPQYWQLNNINSAVLEAAMKEPDILSYLREVYERDSNMFYKVRDEMILRGFEFSMAIRSNRFPALLFEPKLIILIKEELGLYKKIPKGILGIEVLLNRYEAKSDYFLNFVSIEALAHFLKKDEAFIKYQLENVGFEILEVDDVLKIQEQSNSQPKNLEDLASDTVSHDVQPVTGQLETIKSEREVGDAIKKNILPHVLDTTPLEQIFIGTKFIAFHDYCRQQKIEKFSDLDIDVIENFQYKKGVGNTKYKLVKETYLKWVAEYPLKYVFDKSEKIATKLNTFEYYQQNPLRALLESNEQSYLGFLDELYTEQEITENFEQHLEKLRNRIANLIEQENRDKSLNVANHFIEQIKQQPHYRFFEDFKWAHCAEILKLDYLNLESHGYFYEIIHDEDFFEYLEIINFNLSKYIPIHEQLEKFISGLTDRVLNVLLLRVNYTLEIVGQEIGVTRERVRQIEKNAATGINNFFETVHLDVIVQHYLENSFQLHIEELLRYLGIDKSRALFIEYYLKHNEKFIIVDGVIIDKNFKEFFDQKSSEIALMQQELIFVEEAINICNKTEDYEMNMPLVELIMSKQGYFRKNNLYIKNNVKLPALIKHLFKYKIDGAIEMTEDNFEKVQLLMEDNFARKFENGSRAAIARIRDTENVILVDGNTFMYYDLDTVSQEVIDEIGDALEKVLAEWGSTTARVVFDRDQELWQRHGITTHYHLYSIIGYYFSDDYNIGRGNTLSIQVTNGAPRDLYTMLKLYLERYGGQASKKQIIEDLGWKNYTLEQIIGKNAEFFTIETNDGLGIKLFSSFGFTEDEMSKIQTYLMDYIGDNEYLFPSDLMIDMEFEDELSEILANRGVLKIYDFASLIKYFNPKLRGFYQFLFIKNSYYDQFEKVVKEEFPTFLIRNEFEKYFFEKGYALSGLPGSLATLVEQQFFYPYTTSKYINAKEIMITDETLAKLQQYLDQELEEKNYISALDLTGYTSLPSIGNYEWTPYLVAHFASKIGYTIINTIRDYRYNKILLTSKRLGITQYDQLVYKVVKEEYEGNYHERDVAEFLVQKRLAHSPKINYEIRMSDLFEFKDLGFMKLKGE